MSKPRYSYINNEHFTLDPNQVVDGEDHETVVEAIQEAVQDMIDMGIESVRIVKCRYIGDGDDGAWFQDGHDAIRIEVSEGAAAWLAAEDD